MTVCLDHMTVALRGLQRTCGGIRWNQLSTRRNSYKGRTMDDDGPRSLSVLLARQSLLLRRGHRTIQWWSIELEAPGTNPTTGFTFTCLMIVQLVSTHTYFVLPINIVCLLLICFVCTSHLMLITLLISPCYLQVTLPISVWIVVMVHPLRK